MACERPMSADRFNHQIQSQLCYGWQTGNHKILTTINVEDKTERPLYIEAAN